MSVMCCLVGTWSRAGGGGVSLNHHKELEKNYADYDNQDKLNAPGPT